MENNFFLDFWNNFTEIGLFNVDNNVDYIVLDRLIQVMDSL